MTIARNAALAPIPVTVLTGFLGAGKTTLLNRILSEDHGHRYVVIINEYGEIGIDHDLVLSTRETILEMNNGCICCTVRDDLIGILRSLFVSGQRFDGVLIETTGLADPGPVIQTFFVDPVLADRLRLDAVITVADACHLFCQLQTSPEAVEQIALADVILLNKRDLAEDAAMADLTRRIRTLNPIAVIHGTERCNIELGRLLDIHAFDLDRILATEPDFLVSNHDHEHDAAIGSVSLVSHRPMERDMLIEWLTRLLHERGREILRCKGIVDIAGCDLRFAVQGVHMLLDGGFQRRWRPDEVRSSRLVLIGRDLDAAHLSSAFENCVAA